MSTMNALIRSLDIAKLLTDENRAKMIALSEKDECNLTDEDNAFIWAMVKSLREYRNKITPVVVTDEEGWVIDFDRSGIIEEL